MENKKRVVNIIVSDLDLFEEELVRDLIKNEISYVQIENEFHFLDKIFRVYDSVTKEDMIKDLDKMIMSPIDLVFNRDHDDLVRIFSDEKDIFIDCSTDVILPKNNVPTFNKKLVKRNNKMINQKIRSYKR